jgi:hypothetical protein
MLGRLLGGGFRIVVVPRYGCGWLEVRKSWEGGVPWRIQNAPRTVRSGGGTMMSFDVIWNTSHGNTDWLTGIDSRRRRHSSAFGAFQISS